MSSTITVVSNDQSYQTTRQTLCKNPYLMEKITDNVIKLNMSSLSVNIILNYLRDNYLPDDITGVENDLNICGIIAGLTNKVKINVGGKFFSVKKELLASKLEYFNKFFHYYAEHDPDYTSILIDRCFDRFQLVLDHIEKPNHFSISKELELELMFYLLNHNLLISEFINTEAFSYFQLAYNKYNDKSASWKIMKISTSNPYIDDPLENRLDIVKELPSSIYRHDTEYKCFCNSGLLDKCFIIKFKPDTNYELVIKGFLTMNDDSIKIEYLLLKNVVLLDKENDIMVILYDPPKYNGEYRSYPLRICFPAEVEIVYDMSLKDEPDNKIYDGFGFIDSTVSNRYSVKNLVNQSVVSLNLNTIIKRDNDKSHHIYANSKLTNIDSECVIPGYFGKKQLEKLVDKYRSGTSVEQNENNVRIYDTYIFTMLCIQHQTDFKPLYVELLKKDMVICRSELVFDGQYYYIKQLINDIIGLKYLITNHDDITVRLFLSRPISGKITFGYNYNCVVENYHTFRYFI